MTRTRQPGRTAHATATQRKSSRAAVPRNKTSRATTDPRGKPVLGRGRSGRTAELAAELAEHTIQPTAAAIEAERTGVLPLQARPSPRRREIPGPEAETIRAGDEDVSPLGNEYSGEEMPGGSMPAPDQNSVDDIGRAYGVEEEDTGSLRTAAELLGRRDQRRRD